MPSSYDEALTALYRAPHESFVAERQRLAAELKASDDKAGAARLAKLARPTVSAWAVNQLWWHARDAFEELFETAGQLRKGKLSASGAHRKALAQLSARAQKLLSAGGHAASEATLRRVTMTLSGLAAAGSFDPEPAGALTKDRDPPGFEAFGIESLSEIEAAPRQTTPKQSKPEAKGHAAAEAKGHAAAEAKGHAAAEAKKAHEAAEKERMRAAEAQAKSQAERQKLEAALREAKTELTAYERAHEHATKALATAERDVERARAVVDAAEERLATAKREH
jgi:DNA repair exonuclease SbcCD ATPase subunit